MYALLKCQLACYSTVLAIPTLDSEMGDTSRTAEYPYLRFLILSTSTQERIRSLSKRNRAFI